ncbi:unnamed protein product [Spodoptera littoralis]|uniref:Longin domain-containing protein n=1 Tax=Spodoptera littoralis TaxID=7109 RepID=A0A9P0HVE5_SPOLI|nr:unnamed protein product [Spodoptera littoralis]CAH1635096.1 unnamed protein product [Spodoptera littoralis]
MPIVFSAVASDRNIVSNFASCDGNFTEIAEQVLSKLPACNNKMTYSHGTYLLHYISEDDYLYFCITDKLCQRSRAFLFLNEIQRQFIASRRSKDDFTTVLAAEMYRYSEDYNTIVIRKGELDELNSIGVGCSESILGEKILYINNPHIISYSTISHVSATPALLSVSATSSTEEETKETLPSEVSHNTQLAKENNTSRDISTVYPKQESISVIPPKESVHNMSARLYIVIVGMIILVIAMSVCAFGPISCVVVTGIGIYSLLRSYGFRNKVD